MLDNLPYIPPQATLGYEPPQHTLANKYIRWETEQQGIEFILQQIQDLTDKVTQLQVDLRQCRYPF